MIQVATLAPTQADLVQELYDQNPDYFLRISGHPAQPGSALENLTVFPPGFSHSPVLLGAFEGGRLVKDFSQGDVVSTVEFFTRPAS